MMTSLSTFAEIAALAGDPARAGMLPHGRARLDGIRVGLCRQHHATDGERPFGASGYGWSSQRREAGPAPLPSSRIVGCSADDRKHHAGGLRPRLDATTARRRSKRGGFADGADLLRPSRGRLGVALADALVEGGYLELASDGGLVT